MLPQALPWILDQMRVNGKYSNDALKGYLARAYDIETLKVSHDWPEDGMKLFHNYVDWLAAKMTEDSWHRPFGKKMYELTSDGVRKAGELGY